MEIQEFDRSKKGLWERIRAINAQFPWLKVVAAVFFVLTVGFLIEEGLRSNAGRNGEISEVADIDVIEEEESLLPEIEEDKIILKHSAKVVETEVVLPVEQYMGKKLVALTFDDGPSSSTTPRLLQILQEKNVRATFFVVGTMASRSPDILQQEVAAGHEVGSHTMTHANLPRVGVSGIQSETAQMDDLFLRVLGKKPAIMRPPYGSVDDTVRATVPQPMIIWAVDPEDWKYRDAATVRSRVVSASFDGAIILMHDIHASTVDAVPGIIDDLRAQGYDFVTVSELARIRGVAMQPGVAYGSFRP